LDTLEGDIEEHQQSARQAREAGTKTPEAPDPEDAGILEEAPWQLPRGTKAHARVLERGSLETQRALKEHYEKANINKSKGKGKGKEKGNKGEGRELGTKELQEFPTPAEARQHFQHLDRSAASNARGDAAGGTPASTPTEAQGSLGPTPPASDDMDTKEPGLRRKREEVEEVPEEDTRTPDGDRRRGSFRTGDGNSRAT
jgi:hypothetical protein